MKGLAQHQVDGAIVRPRPRQDGGIPLWIAGDGEKVTLKIAAKYARYTNFDGTLEGFTRKSDLLRGHCERVPACGTPEQIVANLRELEAAGMTYGTSNFAEAAYDRSGIELFEREVVPALS